MRIAHISCVFPPYGGGIGQACFQQVKGLANLGHEVVVFTPKYKRERKYFSEEKVKIERIKPIIKIGKAGVLFSLFWKLKNFDLVQLHYPFIGTEIIILLWKKIRKPKAKLVLYYHMDLKGRGIKSLLFKIVNKFITPKMLEIADLILVSSFDYAKNSEIISEYFFQNPAKFSLLPFGVDLEKFKPEEKRKSLLKNYGLSRQDKIILFVGGLDKNHYFKGLPLLFRAIKIISQDEIKLLVVGKGDLLPFYREKSREMSLENQVIFAGYVPDDYLAGHYNLADVFVLPSVDRSEAFGIVLLEAQACGKPVIASNLPGVRTVLKNGETGFLFKVGNAEDLAKKLVYILENESVKLRMGEQARKYMEEKYDIKLISQHLEEIYQDLL